MNIVYPDTRQPIVDDDGKMTESFNRFMNLMYLLDIIVGTGTPEGSIEAGQGRFYMDDTGASGAVLYVKRDVDDGAGDRTKGWIAV